MEGTPYSPPNFEKSSEDLDDSEENSKSKKARKSPEARRANPEIEQKDQEKRESIADRIKAALGEKVVEDSPEKPDTKEPVELKPDEEAEPASEAAVESEPDTEPNSPEDNAEIAEIMPNDEEIDEQVKEANIERLQAEIAATDDEAEIAANEAAIDMLQELPADELTVEADEPDDEEADAESAPEHQDILFGDEDEPLPFEDEGDVPLTPTSSGGPGGKTPPPATPSSPPSPPVPARPTPSLPRFGGPGARQPAAANVMPTDTTEYQPDYRESPNRGYLLVGAVVGYLIGKRRGRIKTEKRMNVVVKKLEKQVEAKQRIIDAKVEAAKHKARQEYWESKGRQQPEAPRPEMAVPSGMERTRPAVARPERFRAIPERRPEDRPVPAEQEAPVVELRDEDVRRISETIKVGETNLRKIYEARLVSPSGLRRIVAEHLQGKDIRRGLAREFLAKELSFERDPRFRDILPQELRGRSAGGAAAITNSIDLTTPLQQPISEDSQPTNAPVTKIPVKKQQRVSVSSGLLAALTLVALGLAAYAVILGLTR